MDWVSEIAGQSTSITEDRPSLVSSVSAQTHPPAQAAQGSALSQDVLTPVGVDTSILPNDNQQRHSTVIFSGSTHLHNGSTISPVGSPISPVGSPILPLVDSPVQPPLGPSVHPGSPVYSPLGSPIHSCIGSPTDQHTVVSVMTSQRAARSGSPSPPESAPAVRVSLTPEILSSPKRLKRDSTIVGGGSSARDQPVAKRSRPSGDGIVTVPEDTVSTGTGKRPRRSGRPAAATSNRVRGSNSRVAPSTSTPSDISAGQSVTAELSAIHSAPIASDARPTLPTSIPQDAPKWFLNATTLLQSAPWQGSWAALLRGWIAYELRKDLNDDGKLGTTSRPECIKMWIARARSSKWHPKIDLDVFEGEFWCWWKSLQPEWRQSLQQEGGDITVLDKPGANGIVSVIVALFYWGKALGSGRETSSEWLRAVKDVEWVLAHL